MTWRNHSPLYTTYINKLTLCVLNFGVPKFQPTRPLYPILFHPLRMIFMENRPMIPMIKKENSLPSVGRTVSESDVEKFYLTLKMLLHSE